MSVPFRKKKIAFIACRFFCSVPNHVDEDMFKRALRCRNITYSQAAVIDIGKKPRDAGPLFDGIIGMDISSNMLQRYN